MLYYFYKERKYLTIYLFYILNFLKARYNSGIMNQKANAG